MGVRISWLMLARNSLFEPGGLFGAFLGLAQFGIHGDAVADLGKEVPALPVQFGVAPLNFAEHGIERGRQHTEFVARCH